MTLEIPPFVAGQSRVVKPKRIEIHDDMGIPSRIRELEHNDFSPGVKPANGLVPFTYVPHGSGTALTVMLNS